jgi:hypothetical protein
MAQFTYNNAVHTTTGETLFFTNYGYNPILIGEPQNKEAVSEEAEEVINIINYIRTQLSRDIKFMNLCIVIYYNKKYRSTLDLKRGEKVYLLCRNIKIKRLS